MVLIDDPDKTVIEPLFDRAREKAYDFPLMLGGGHIRGYRVDDDQSIRLLTPKVRIPLRAAAAGWRTSDGTTGRASVLATRT